MVAVRLLVLLLALCRYSHSGEVIVELPEHGKLRGSTTYTTRTSRTIYQFLGVRYGLLQQRFKEAASEVPWTDVRDATAYGPRCPQFTVDWPSEFDGQMHWAAAADPTLSRNGKLIQVEESENCLTLDVYTPNVDPEVKLPVLVFFHGGTFIGGSSSNVQPGYLLEHDLVLVAPQYRLGPLGFLCLHTDDAPGNAGLSDMLLAMQWVRDFIQQFGGDPERITVAGNSAGAAGAGLLQLSPLSYTNGTGLFRQVLQMSGTAIAPFALDESPVKHSLTLAAAAGCAGSSDADFQSVVTCMGAANLTTLRSAFIANGVEDILAGGTGLGGSMPVVQRAGAIRIIEQHPLDLLMGDNYHNMPYLTGVTKHEGIFLTQVVRLYMTLLKMFTPEVFCCGKTIEDLLFRLMMTDYNKVVGNALVEKYFKPPALSSMEGVRNSLIDFTGALYFKGPAQTNVIRNSVFGSSSYLYTFNHQDILNAEGVTHASDFIYVFPSSGVLLTPEENEVSAKMVELFANFVLNGRPDAAFVPEWPAYWDDDPAYMVFDSQFEVRSGFESEFTVAADYSLHKNTAPTAAPLLASVIMAAAARLLR